LEARRIAHVLVGGRSFHSREEVMALRTAMRAIEWPDDELSVFATLKGPFFALGDEALLIFRHALGKLHPLRPYASPPVEEADVAQVLAPVVEALQLLGGLHRERNKRPVSGTMHAFLEATRAHAGVAFWKAAPRRWRTCCTWPSGRRSSRSARRHFATWSSARGRGRSG